MHMETSFHLSPTEDGTRMRWHADVRILGAVGSLGHRVLEPIVNQQIEHVLGALDAEVTAASV
jgi:carbon monoxide dehydrogenase subunit G